MSFTMFSCFTVYHNYGVVMLSL
uniref:Uncharacterized protein n=1 Tax=Anguilla anguilla TaxID=7936 RepID=A0A0E9PET8_ANGAN